MKTWLTARLSFFESFLADLDTPRSLATWLMIREGLWDDLAIQWVDPLHYPEGVFSALRYRKDVQAVDLLRKAPLPTTFSRTDAAIKAWEDAETQCYITNEFISSLSLVGGGPSSPHAKRLLGFLGAVKRRMKRWLGPIPDSMEWGFGPGTCVEYKGQDPTVVDKLWLTPTSTPDAAFVFGWSYRESLWGRTRWACQLPSPQLSRGNRLTTVPKDGKSDRPISIEPLGNLWLQLGIGRFMKRRLHHIGLPAYKPASWELFPGYVVKGEDAQAVHRQLLGRCSRDGLSTIDLSSASDTIALELVRNCFPPDWFELMDCSRSKWTSVPSEGVDGKPSRAWRQLEKFSSMGNGFTFEMESLLFTCLLSVAFGLTPGHDLWVFGDDIILPRRHFDAACNLLSTFGFTPNRRKSYKDGPFFESCGGNVHSGLDVTPTRLKHELDEATELYAFHNACFARGFSRRTLRKVRDWIPRRLQFPGPQGLGDIVLHGLPFTPLRRVDWPHSWWLRTLRTIPSNSIPLERWSDELAMVALLLGSSTQVVRRHTPVTPVAGYTSIS